MKMHKSQDDNRLIRLCRIGANSLSTPKVNWNFYWRYEHQFSITPHQNRSERRRRLLCKIAKFVSVNGPLETIAPSVIWSTCKAWFVQRTRSHQRHHLLLPGYQNWHCAPLSAILFTCLSVYRIISGRHNNNEHNQIRSEFHPIQKNWWHENLGCFMNCLPVLNLL